MHPLQDYWKKESRYVIGLMSGTSADGIDAVLTNISGFGLTTRVTQSAFCFTPFTLDVRERILYAAGGGPLTTEELCRLNVLLGQLYAEACEDLCRKAGLLVSDIDLVGCHGQTIWHSPVPEEYLGRRIASTLQIGETAVIAEALGCPVIGDFRVRDMAAGGQGAPLVPYTEFLLYREEKQTVALQNIGGIGNVTILPAGGGLSQVMAFDTGPGNMVLDQLTERLTGGQMHYDEGGKLAAKGQVSGELLSWMMEDSYLKKKPPKTTGREAYGEAYLDRLLAKADGLGVSLLDTLATATRFTAETIAYGIHRFSPAMPNRLVVNGGGCWNRTLMAHLRALMPDCQVMTGEDLGYSSDAKEAVAFAVLANEAAFGMCGNVPSVTGARGPVVMGKLSL